MKRTIFAAMILLTCTTLMFTGCSGSSSDTAASPTTAILSLATSGTPTTIYGIEVNVVLPDGVTVQTMPSSSETITGAVVSAGSASGSYIVGSYTAATGSTPGKVKVVVTSGSGFALGEYAIVTCDIAPGHSPVGTDFTLSDFLASGPTGSEITGLINGLIAEIR